ncbi:MAG: VanZ family protein, partial [Candidatus Acidiferrum sp.]
RPWDEFRPNLGYLDDLAINVAGFIPLGFFFCLYAKSNPAETRPELKIILVGAGISLLIEVLQSFLPTRSSGMTDLITNTSGTALGVYVSGNRWIGTFLEQLVSAVERRSRSQTNT